MMSTRMYVCESGEHPSSLLSGLNEQRLKGLLCDATVRVQGHLFKAHVNVLASSMGYFRDLFINSGKEKPHNVVEIPMIVNSTGFAKILDFVYTSQLCLSQSTVMQVLCSACYLQIPYVVEKCQEFITTHGHVTSPSSLSEVAAPLLQGLQQANFPKLSGSQLHQSASASLSFLSQLNRLSEKSRARYAELQTKQKSSASPQQAQAEGDDQQECVLINTPPSPADRHRISPENAEDKDTNAPLSLKRERDPETVSNEDKRATYSPSEKYVNGNPTDDQPAAKRFIYTNPQQAVDYGAVDSKAKHDVIDHKSLADYFSAVSGQQDADSRISRPLHLDEPQDTKYTKSQTERETIDHKSLADYFSTTPKERGLPPVSSYSLQLNGHQDKSSYRNSDKQLMDLSKANNRISSILDSTIAAAPKKERPKKEYRCDYCGKMFGRQQHLKRHILTHTGERPYPCPYCDKRFRRSEHLKHHVANHEQAMGIEPTTTKKKTRKPARADDAYSLSQLMLEQYRTPESVPRLMVGYGDVPSAPVILPSMFVDPERSTNQKSPEAAPVTEIEDTLAPPSDQNEDSNEHRQASPSSYAEQSPMTALNLCRDATKEREKSVSPVTQSGVVNSDVLDGNLSEEKAAESNQNSPNSHSNAVNGVSDMLDDNHASSDLIAMAGSEVLTPDLKRLIAALDQ